MKHFRRPISSLLYYGLTCTRDRRPVKRPRPSGNRRDHPKVSPVKKKKKRHFKSEIHRTFASFVTKKHSSVVCTMTYRPPSGLRLRRAKCFVRDSRRSGGVFEIHHSFNVSCGSGKTRGIRPPTVSR